MEFRFRSPLKTPCPSSQGRSRPFALPSLAPAFTPGMDHKTTFFPSPIHGASMQRSQPIFGCNPLRRRTAGHCLPPFSILNSFEPCYLNHRPFFGRSLSRQDQRQCGDVVLPRFTPYPRSRGDETRSFTAGHLSSSPAIAGQARRAAQIVARVIFRGGATAVP
jgi:hypothetical protein